MNRELETDPNVVALGDMSVEVSSVWSDYVGDNVYSDYLADPMADPNANPSIPLYTDLAMYQPGIEQVTGLDTPSSESSYYMTNHLGTTINRFDKNAVSSAPATYTAFGERIDIGTFERYGYAGSWGYQQHSEFPFQHVGARYYDSTVWSDQCQYRLVKYFCYAH